MTIRHITLFLDPQLPTRDLHALDFACEMASKLHAEIRAIIYPITTDGPVDAALRLVFDAARDKAHHRADQAGVQMHVVDRSSFAYGIGDVFADYLKVSDLGVIAVGRSLQIPMRMMLVAGVFNSGRPILALPDTSGPFGVPKRIMLGWDSSPAAARALKALLPLAAHAEETLISAVSDDKEARLDQSGVEAARYVALHGGRATFHGIEKSRRSALQALLSSCASTNSDLLALGAVRHSPLRDLVFGGVTRELLEQPPSMPILLMA
jgi:nucleotide-binding universal stress UspA family protein